MLMLSNSYKTPAINDIASMCIIAGGLFLINPLLGILLSTIFASNRNQRQAVGLVLVLLVLYLSALNTTKDPDNDMLRYIEMFDKVLVDGYSGTLKYMSGGTDAKDVFYASLVYILYYILGGNSFLFVFVISLLIFSFAFLSIFKFCKEYDLPNFYIVAMLLSLGFFVQYFTLSFHIVRQELATSLFLYAITFRCHSLKKYLFWSVISIMTHSFIIVFVFLSLFPFMKRKMKLKHIAMLITFAFSFVAVFSAVASYVLGNFDIGGYAAVNIDRVATMEGEGDGAGNESVGVIVVFSIIMLVLSFIDIARKAKMYYPIVVNLSFVSSLLVLGLSVSPLLQSRFYFILYTLMPFVVFLLFKRNIILLKLSCWSFVLLMLLLFYRNLNNVFQYVSAEDAIILPYFFLIQI